MKKVIQLVLLFLISFASIAQFSHTVVKKAAFPKANNSLNHLRTSSVEKQRLDSIVAQSIKYEYTYDANGNSILEIGYDWDPSENVWDITSKVEYGYDMRGNLTLQIDYDWDGLAGALNKGYKYAYTYDLNNNQTSEITYHWNAVYDVWEEKYKTENSFNAEGLITQSMKYYWVASAWTDNGNIQFTYDNNELLLTEIEYTPWNSLNSKRTYTYDMNGKVISVVRSFYNGTEFYDDWKDEYSYDVNGNATLEQSFRWNSQIEEWIGEYKTENEFDLQNNNSVVIYSHWNDQTGTWEYSSKNIYSYDNAYTAMDLYTPMGFSEIFHHKLAEVSTYYFVDGYWEVEEEYTLYYKNALTTAINNVSTANLLSVYPNPALGEVVFTNQTNDAVMLQLFNAQGQLSYSNKIIMNKPVSLEGMEAGIYFYSVSGDASNSYSGTLIIE